MNDVSDLFASPPLISGKWLTMMLAIETALAEKLTRGFSENKTVLHSKSFHFLDDCTVDVSKTVVPQVDRFCNSSGEQRDGWGLSKARTATFGDCV